MGIGSLINRMCKQTAVYWGNPVADGYGGFTFDSPREVKCRWEDKKQLIMDNQGKEIVARSIVYVLEDLDEQGYLFWGKLSDAAATDGDGYPDEPRKIAKAYEIKRFHTIPGLRDSGEAVRSAYLSERVGV